MGYNFDFANFQNLWTPVALAKDIGDQLPLGIVIASTPVVLFYDEKGKINALIDRCPHRSAKLSQGTVTREGTLRCPFHGWEYVGTGACVHIPLNKGANVKAVRAENLPCEVRGGLVWIYTSSGLLASAVPALQAPETLNWFGSLVSRDWSCHWSRAIQTMLDVAHIPYVHPMTIGSAFGRKLGQMKDSELTTKILKKDSGAFRLDWSILDDQGKAMADAGWLDFLPPNGLTLGIPMKNKNRTSLLHIWCVPTTDGHSKMIVASRRNFGKYSLLPRIFDLLTPVILREDRIIQEHIWPSEVPEPGFEISMPADAPTIAFSKYYGDFVRQQVQGAKDSKISP